jgi:integrase/recombinase XerD
MAKSKQQIYDRNRNTLKEYKEDGEISDEEYNHIIEMVDANDPDRHMTQMPNGKTKAPGTLAAYCYQIGRVARDSDFDLTEATERDINLLMQDYLTGDVRSVTKDGGLSKGSVSKMQAPMRIFYRYHTDIGVEPENITLSKREETPVEPRDIFDPEDVEALRGEAKETGLRDISTQT